MNKHLGVGALIGGILGLAPFIGMILTVDARYVHAEDFSKDEFLLAADFRQFQEDFLSGQLRELEKEMREAERSGDPEWEADVLEAYEELLDEFCQEYPDNRRCK